MSYIVIAHDMNTGEVLAKKSADSRPVADHFALQLENRFARIGDRVEIIVSEKTAGAV